MNYDRRLIYEAPVSEIVPAEPEAIICVSVAGTDPYGPGPVYNDFV